jgi:hypothetical protein
MTRFSLVSLLFTLFALPVIAFAQSDSDALLGFGIMGTSTLLICSCAWLLVDIAIIVWVYRDASSRGENAILWVIVVLFLNLLGLILYLIFGRRNPQSVPPA